MDTGDGGEAQPVSLHVIAIGGEHQFAHFIPVACEMARRENWAVTVFVATQEQEAALFDFIRKRGLCEPAVVVMKLGGALSALLPKAAHKIARLITWSPRLRSCDLLLMAERTSTVLKRLPGACPPMVHIPHGAGDRAIGFEKRIALFDLVLVAGDKDKERMLAEGIMPAEKCVVGGPIKVATLLKEQGRAERVFANDRPIIVYNPHFKTSLSSSDVMPERLVEAVLRDGRYNLIIAPHVRLAERWSPERRAQWQAFAQEDRILVDLGSARSYDMTYTLAADVYLGDVSSQVYEFCIRPRPCLFVNAHGIDWQDDPNYAMWHLGDVMGPDDDIIAAIDGALAHHSRYAERQRARIRHSLYGMCTDEGVFPHFGDCDPVALSANLIADFAYRKISQSPASLLPSVLKGVSVSGKRARMVEA